jgi:hypothetical protein
MDMKMNAMTDSISSLSRFFAVARYWNRSSSLKASWQWQKLRQVMITCGNWANQDTFLFTINRGTKPKMERCMVRHGRYLAWLS